MDVFGVMLLLIAVAAAFQFMALWRARRMLNDWARERHYQILSARFCWWRGPFLWHSSRGPVVYRVVIRTPDGQVQHGWVRCGGFMLGIWSNKADAKWEG